MICINRYPKHALKTYITLLGNNTKLYFRWLLYVESTNNLAIQSDLIYTDKSRPKTIAGAFNVSPRSSPLSTIAAVVVVGTEHDQQTLTSVTLQN